MDSVTATRRVTSSESRQLLTRHTPRHSALTPTSRRRDMSPPRVTRRRDTLRAQLRITCVVEDDKVPPPFRAALRERAAQTAPRQSRRSRDRVAAAAVCSTGLLSCAGLPRVPSQRAVSCGAPQLRRAAAR